MTSTASKTTRKVAPASKTKDPDVVDAQQFLKALRMMRKGDFS